jgi:DNA recombination protein RmuC
LLERAIKAQAKIIADKYIDVPQSTDFAIMYLPTEGLFAEVVRRPGLASELQNKFRVLITGPTTLMSLLNSLQMGFKTLAIEKSTSDVWKILSAAKAEFQKYGQVWDKLQKQLNTAQNTVSAAKTRTNAIERTLRNVETGAGIEASEEFQAIESLAAEIEAEDAIDQGDEEQD